LPEICAGIIERNALVNGYVRIIVSRGVDAEGIVGYLPKGSKPILSCRQQPSLILRLRLSAYGNPLTMRGFIRRLNQ